jgi:O-antigen/teichoic acid export membrane protein
MIFMDKALSLGKTSATGSFQLLIGVVVSTVIMAVGTIFLARVLPAAADYGLYGVALIPSSIINFFRDWGINSAMTKQIASLRMANKEAEIHDVIVSGMVFEVISGATLSLLCFVLSSFFASVLNAPEASLFIAIMSLSIFAGAILAAASSIFVGFENMKLNSLTVVCQAIVKTAVGPLLVLIGYGVLGAVIGAVVSYVAAGLIGAVAVFFVFLKPLRKVKVGKCHIYRTIKPMFAFGAPLMMSNFVLGVLPLLINSLMFIYAGALMYGNYSAALNFAVLATFITIPINTVLFPAFSKLSAEKDQSLMQTVFASSVKYTSVLMVPATLAIMILSTPMVNTLFGYLPSGDPKYSFAPQFLALTVAVNLLALVGNFSIGNFLAGVGETKLLMKQGILTLVLGLPLAFLLVPSFGVVGGIIGTMAAGIPSMLWGLSWIWKRYKVKVELRASARIITAALIATFAAFLFLNAFSAADWIRLVLGFAVFLVAYLTSAPLVGAINQVDVNNLRAMFSDLGLVSKILEIPFRFIEKSLKIRQKQHLSKSKNKVYCFGN